MSTSNTIDEILGRATCVSLGDNDVVFGRGGFTNRHHGNIEYLKLLGEHEEAYMECKRKFQKLLSLCIIHQLRCKGVQFLKKDEKSGQWKTVKLGLCRLKISQRLRERAPFIKLEQMKASKVITKTNNRPVIDVAVPTKKSYPVPVMSPPMEIITVSDASGDEESVGLDDVSFCGGDNMTLTSSFESMFGEIGPLELAEPQFQVEESNGKRFADSTFATGTPQRKRRRTVSMDDSDFANMLLKEASLLDDISVSSCGTWFEEETNDTGMLDGIDQDVMSSFDCAEAPIDEMMQYLQILF